ncbi:hypothetical protein RIF29_36045 [Crotalaria pallida]|uniref:Uncharacterized protein n=1 Tax=Crotalaria pallida TaxID=3830 RepID=A0AAN9HYB1_CROPI
MEKILVYPCMSNGRLSKWLHPLKSEAMRLKWPERVNIALGLARGLSWFHHSCDLRILANLFLGKDLKTNSLLSSKLCVFTVQPLPDQRPTMLQIYKKMMNIWKEQRGFCDDSNTPRQSETVSN